MLAGSPYTRPQEVDLQLDLINHFWDTTASADYLTKANAWTRATLDCVEDVRVGPREEERLDYFPAKKPNSPILIFVHGGWWRGHTRKGWSYIAKGFVEHGYAVVISDYALCPKVTVPDITQATRAAVVWTYENAELMNGNRDRLFLTGHSAGGQQAGMVAVTDWTQCGLPWDAVKAVVPISGIFDMRPLQSCWLQPYLQLNGDTALTESPLFHVPERAPPLLVMLGDEESEEFHRQSTLFAEAWRARGHRADYLSVPGEDHTTAIFWLGVPDSAPVKAMLEFFESC